MPDYVIGVDGGNSKTDVVIASFDGRVLARARGSGTESPLVDPAAWRKRLVSLIDEARHQAGLQAQSKAASAVLYLANVDLPSERRIARRELLGAEIAHDLVVENDTLAVLRAGSRRPWGVALVSGAGINAIGQHPSGRIARFLALGDYTGDYGGGQSLGIDGLGAAVRARDGRGPNTLLAKTVPEYYGLRRPEDVALAVHRGTISYDDLHVLAPTVFAAADAGDEVALGIIRTLSDEAALMATALIRRLRLSRTDLDVVLGGGTLQAGNAPLIERIAEGVIAQAPKANVTVLDVPPVFGALREAYRQVDVTGDPVVAIKHALIGNDGAGVA